MRYAWQLKDWELLVHNWQNRPNALMIAGKKNCGAYEFVKQYAKAILCEHTSADKHLPCGHCHSCHLFEQNSHPDFYEVMPEKKEETSFQNDVIKIEAIRQIITKIQNSSYLSGWKVVLIEPAEAMNMQAANALLKILEESPTNTIFILISYNVGQLIPTIMSRCLKFYLSTPNVEAINEMVSQQSAPLNPEQLAIIGGFPLSFENYPWDLYREFVEVMSNPRVLICMDFAVKYDKQFKSMSYFYDWLYKWLVDAVLSKQHLDLKFNIAHKSQFENSLQKKRLEDLFYFFDIIKERLRYKQVALNVKLQVEDLLLEYLMLSTKRKEK